MSTGTIDRPLGQPGETGVDKSVELAEISGMSLEGADKSGLLIFRVCLMESMEGKVFKSSRG
jgi:hypothetical protein